MLSVLGQSISAYRLEKVRRRYFDDQKNILTPVWLPTASPEFMVLEECWNISKNDLLVLTYYASYRFQKESWTLI
jgi:hypothetical protein